MKKETEQRRPKEKTLKKIYKINGKMST